MTKQPKSDNVRVTIEYTNWRGERSTRVIEPRSVRFGNTEWHKTNQWLLRARDVDREGIKEFAMKDIHSWTPVD